LLLDEPTASLDGKNSAAVVELIEQAKARGAAIVGIFHDEAVRRRSPTDCTRWGNSMIINNVKLVLEDEVVHGSLEVQDGAFAPLPKARAARGDGRRRRLAAAGAYRAAYR
jgi:energy-coupling factor transporter ATP-binding protein EcfA2